MSTDINSDAQRAAIRKALWTCIDALGIRGQVEPTDTMVDAVIIFEGFDLELTEALVLGVFFTNAAEQQMTLAVEAHTEVEPEKREDLVGRTVTAVHLGSLYADSDDLGSLYADSDDVLYLTCSDGNVLALQTDGECCSTTWWNDILQVKQLLGATVTGIEYRQLPLPEDPNAYECLQDYGIRITTNRGACDLVYRNSSNGYYGGSCYARWLDALPADVNLKPITEDYGA